MATQESLLAESTSVEKRPELLNQLKYLIFGMQEMPQVPSIAFKLTVANEHSLNG